jgi:hypothetical protein
MADMFNRGRANRVRGQKHGRAKLSLEAIADIRRGEISNVEYAKRYGVAASTISAVKIGQTWRAA